MKPILTIIFSLLFCELSFSETLLTCKATTKESTVKTLVLIKTGDQYSAKMESVIEDGVVDIQIKTPVVTKTATKYILVEDHDFKMTLATFGKKAVVLSESIYDASEPTDVEFLNCK